MNTQLYTKSKTSEPVRVGPNFFASHDVYLHRWESFYDALKDSLDGEVLDDFPVFHNVHKNVGTIAFLGRIYGMQAVIKWRPDFSNYYGKLDIEKRNDFDKKVQTLRDDGYKLIEGALYGIKTHA